MITIILLLASGIHSWIGLRFQKKTIKLRQANTALVYNRKMKLDGKKIGNKLHIQLHSLSLELKWKETIYLPLLIGEKDTFCKDSSCRC